MGTEEAPSVDVAFGSWLVVQAWWLHTFRPGGQVCRTSHCSPCLLRHSLRLLLVPSFSPRVLSPDSSCSILRSPLARAWSLTTCTRASIFIVMTSAPWTALAWTKTTSPKGTFGQSRGLCRQTTCRRAPRLLMCPLGHRRGWLRTPRLVGSFLSPASPASWLPHPSLH